MRNRFPRSFYIPTGAVKVADKASSAIAYIYESGGKPCARGFQGKADKPNFHHYFATAEKREKHVRAFFQSIREHEQRRKDRRESRKAFAHSVKVGDIFRTSWGYDQTNVEFFEVVEIKGKHAILREIASAGEDNGHGSEKCVAQSGEFLTPRYKGDDRGQPIRRLIHDGHVKIDNVRTGYAWGTRGPGGIILGDACHRTSSYAGH